MVDLLNVVCSDYIMMKVVTIMKRVIDIIRIVTPILLIVGGTITFTKGVINPEGKGGKSETVGKFLNGVFATVIVMFLPFIINTVMLIISTYGEVGVRENGNTTAFQLSSCWTNAGISNSNMNSTNGTTKSIYQESRR